MLLIVAMLCVSGDALAEGGRAVLKRGLSLGEVTKRLGAPDEVRSSADEIQWLYGKSLVFFRDGTVVAWSDTGDLVEREQLQGLSLPDQVAEVSFLDYGWSNAWTKEAPVSKGEVVDELIVDNTP